MKHFVITGAPSSGKSTLIKALADLGFHVLPEAARELLESSELKENHLNFQESIENLQFERETACQEAVAFFDRGLPDSLAYRRMLGFAEEEVLARIDACRYAGVFLCRFGEHSPDGVRFDDTYRSLMIERHIRDTYMSLGCPVVELPWHTNVAPPLGILRRLEIISSHLSSVKNEC